ncbi:hypothetical protein, partial [Metallibacterium sp.]
MGAIDDEILRVAQRQRVFRHAEAAGRTISACVAAPRAHAAKPIDASGFCVALTMRHARTIPHPILRATPSRA